MFVIFSVSLFYNFALVNGTLEKTARYLLYACRRFPGLLPFALYLASAGIAALGTFLILLFVYFRMMCVAMSKERDWTSRIHQIALTAGVCGFLVQAMTDYSFYNYRVLFLFWAYLAIGALCARRSELPKGRLLT